MNFERRNILDVLFLPLGLIAFAVFSVWTVYAGPDSADKIAERRSMAVFQALDREHFEWVDPEVDGQSVRLRGEAPTSELRYRAIEAARTAQGPGGYVWGGIKRVVDEMSVQPPVESYRLTAILNNGKVSLTGHLPGVNALDRLTERLNREGYTDSEIATQIEFSEGMPPGDWLGAVDIGLTQLVRLSEARFDVVDQRLTLRGQSISAAAKSQIIQRLMNLPSGYTADVDLSGTAVWSARLDGDILVLSGAMPGATERTEILELTSRFFDGRTDNDQVIKPMKNVDWVTGIRVALPGFLKFQSGRIDYMGDEILVTGRASQSVIDHLRQDVARYGSPIDFRMNAQPTPVELEVFSELNEKDIPSGDVCEKALDESMTFGRLSFRYGSESLSRESGAVIDAVETVLRRCSDKVLKVSAYTHTDQRRTASKRLTEARQRVVSDYFIARGVPLKQIRLTEVSEGVSAPESGIDSVDASQIRLRFEE